MGILGETGRHWEGSMVFLVGLGVEWAILEGTGRALVNLESAVVHTGRVSVHTAEKLVHVRLY